MKKDNGEVEGGGGGGGGEEDPKVTKSCALIYYL